jgi:hypothetical protein
LDLLTRSQIGSESLDDGGNLSATN